jgi:carboxymethylenebutenolidase
MLERQIDIPTPHGDTTTFIVHPERGGPHPPILFFMDAPAIREELRDMARRLASAGYYVMLPNMYYRAGVMELGALTEPGARDRMFELMNGLSIPLVMSDAKALVEFIDADPAARPGGIGTLGYCMSGQYAVNAAAAFPGRVVAAASLYGVRLVTEEADSPHLMAKATKADIYFGCAEIDHWAPLEMVEQLRNSLADQGERVEVELYPHVEHGFAFPQRAAYNKDAAERHWERLMALYRRRLG